MLIHLTFEYYLADNNCNYISSQKAGHVLKMPFNSLATYSRTSIILGITSLLLFGIGCGSGGRGASENTGRGTVQYLTVNGSYLTQVNAISADGSVIVGSGDNYQVFRWTASGNGQELQSPDGRLVPLALSADGSVVTGYVYTQNGSEPSFLFRWSISGGMQYIEFPGAKRVIVKGVSTNGSILAGYYSNSAGRNRAFRWTVNTGVQDIGTLGGNEASVTAISTNGAILAGGSLTSTGKSQPFLWTEAGGMKVVELPFMAGVLHISDDASKLLGYTVNKEGFANYFHWTSSGGAKSLGTLEQRPTQIQTYKIDKRVSGDASVIIGSTQYGFGVQPEAFRWTESGGLEKLGTSGSAMSFALAISTDGSTVVGFTSDSTGDDAYRWTQSGGMQKIEMPDRGNSSATHTSANGAFVAGYTILTDVTENRTRAFRWSKK